MNPSIPLRILRQAKEALREVNRLGYAQPLDPRLITRVAQALAGLSHYVTDAEETVTVDIRPDVACSDSTVRSVGLTGNAQALRAEPEVWVLECGAVDLLVGDPSRLTVLSIHSTRADAQAEGAHCGFDYRIYSPAAPAQPASTDKLPANQQPSTDASDAKRYRWLRTRPLDSVSLGGVFAGRTPENEVLNGVDLDAAIDAAISASGQSHDAPETNQA